MRTTISHKARFFLYSSPIDGRLYALVSYKDQAGPVNGKCFKLNSRIFKTTSLLETASKVETA